MQKIIQITIGGRVIPIEERAYALLDSYITQLERQFAGEAGMDEIIQDIETRIGELFFIRLEAGAHAIDSTDVKMVMETLGQPADMAYETPAAGMGSKANTNSSYKTQYHSGWQPNYTQQDTRRIFRNPNDKVFGGVCSGLANYFGIDTVIVRLIFAILFLTAGLGLLAYILAWIIIPVARTPQEMYYMSGATPMDFQTMKRNMGDELKDLKQRGEEMSNELKDFFRNKK